MSVPALPYFGESFVLLVAIFRTILFLQLGRRSTRGHDQRNLRNDVNKEGRRRVHASAHESHPGVLRPAVQCALFSNQCAVVFQTHH